MSTVHYKEYYFAGKNRSQAENPESDEKPAKEEEVFLSLCAQKFLDV